MIGRVRDLTVAFAVRSDGINVGMVKRCYIQVAAGECQFFTVWSPGQIVYARSLFRKLMCPEPSIVGAVGFNQADLGATSNVCDGSRAGC